MPKQMTNKMLLNHLTDRKQHLEDIIGDIEYLGSLKDKIESMAIVISFKDDDGETSKAMRFLGDIDQCVGLCTRLLSHLTYIQDDIPVIYEED